MRIHAIFSCFSALLISLVLAGCVSVAEIVPAPHLAENGGNKIIREVNNIHIEVSTSAWKGDPAIETEVTPIKVRLENKSKKMLRFSVSDFAFVDSASNKYYSALPLYNIKGSIEKPVVVPGYPIIPRPYFYYYDFHVAPYYGPIYPDIPPFYGPFNYDPFYYQQHYTYWIDIELPTREMYEQALPDGVLDPGGKVEGFLYFEKISPRPATLYFQAKFKDEDKQLIGEASLPFLVI